MTARRLLLQSSFALWVRCGFMVLIRAMCGSKDQDRKSKNHGCGQGPRYKRLSYWGGSGKPVPEVVDPKQAVGSWRAPNTYKATPAEPVLSEPAVADPPKRRALLQQKRLAMPSLRRTMS